MENNYIDVYFDFRNDSNGKDPDSASKTLRHYHRLLWSKKLPSGKIFNLDESKKNIYLYHKSELGEYYLSSDCILHTYSKWQNTQHIITQMPKNEFEKFYDLSYTIGSFLIFPGNQINRLLTINQERGMNKKINDRIDLTLECIRRYYNSESSPMADTIRRYNEFFSLFTDFKGYCGYFLLQDLTLDNFSKINYFLPFNNFINNPLPNDIDEYTKYKNNSIEFVHKRNKRIEEYNNELKKN